MHHFAAELESDKPDGSLCDSESGETSPAVSKSQEMIQENSGVTNNVSYQSLVQLLEQVSLTFFIPHLDSCTQSCMSLSLSSLFTISE